MRIWNGLGLVTILLVFAGFSGAQAQVLGGCVMVFKGNGSLGQDLASLDLLSTRVDDGTPARFEVSASTLQSGNLRLLTEWSGEFIEAPSGASGDDHVVNLSLGEEEEQIVLSAASLHEAPKTFDVHMELERRDAKALVPGRYRLPVTVTCAAE